MEKLLTALIALFKEVIAPFLSGWIIRESLDNEKEAVERSNRLAARLEVEREVSALPIGSAANELREQWNGDERRNKVRGMAPDLH